MFVTLYIEVSKLKAKIFNIILAIIITLLFAIQFMPVKTNNPPALSDFSGPENIKAILQRSCYDCHSNLTHWPWYSQIAPISWLISHDVQEGREHLNFSTWDSYSIKKQTHKIEEIWEHVEKAEMPPKTYLYLHSKAKLSAADKEAMKNWAIPTVEEETFN